MAHVASTSVAPNAATVSLTIPGTSSPGDVAVIQLGMSDTYTPSLPAGWDVRITGTIGNLLYRVLSRTLEEGDAGTVVNIGVGASQKAFGSISVGSAMSESATIPTPVAANTESTTRAVGTASLPGTRQVFTGVIARGNSSPTNWTAPDGFTRTTQAFGTSTGACNGAVAYVEATAGSIGGGNWVANVADLRAVTWVMVFDPTATQLGTPVVSVVESDPSAPGGTDGEIEVSWDSIAFADHYILQRAPGNDATTGFVTVADDITGTSYTIMSVASGAYSVRVAAEPED